MGLIQIHTRNLPNVVWLNADACSFHINQNIDLWRIRVSEEPALLNKYLSVMNPAETDRGNRFFQQKDKHRHITTRGALRLILSKYLNEQPKTIEFGFGENNKPFIINNKQHNLYFNVSHSGNWILIGVSDNELGVDVEYRKPHFNYSEIINLNFSQKEDDYITQNQSLERFFLLWTRKEAFLKATGQGLNNNLSKFNCLDGLNEADSNIVATTKNWFISSFELHNAYPASIAISPDISKIFFFEIHF